MPRKSVYISSVVLILFAFVGISVLKFWQFMVHPGKKSEKFKPHGIIAAVLTFVCVAVIVALGCIAAFTRLDNKTFYTLLYIVCAFFVVGAGAAARIACLGPKKNGDDQKTADYDDDLPPSMQTNIQRGDDPNELFEIAAEDIEAGDDAYDFTCCHGCVNACLERPPRNLFRHYRGAVIASFIIKFIGMFVSLMFAAADLVQLFWQFRDLPDTGLNGFMETLGSDVGGWKYAAIVACILCNLLLNDQFVETFLDKGKSAWEVVGLQVLYFLVENIDNYAALCFGNISQDLTDANPLFSFIAGLMFGQFYGSDLWVVGKNMFWICLLICYGLIRGVRECLTESSDSSNQKEDSTCSSVCHIFYAIILYTLAITAAIFVVIVMTILLVGQIIPPIIDSFALPFIFFQFILGIGEDSRQFEDDEENGDERKETVCDTFIDCCNIKDTWDCTKPHKIWHRIIQCIFTVGLCLLIYAKR